MARKQYRPQARQLRSDDEQIPDSIPAIHRLWVGVVNDALLHAGIGHYVGKWGASGKLTIRFYADDDASETFITVRDNPAQWAADTLKVLVSPGLAEEALRRGVELERWEAARVAKKA